MSNFHMKLEKLILLNEMDELNNYTEEDRKTYIDEKEKRNLYTFFYCNSEYGWLVICGSKTN